jgi:hypothetical protein
VFVCCYPVLRSVFINREEFPRIYTELAAFAGESRYTDRSGDTWHAGGGPPPAKPFSSMGSGGVPPRDTWGPSSDRKGDSSQNWGRPMDTGTSER